MKKSELNQNIHLQEGNSVLVDNENYGFLIFSLPARECCPYATELCKKICYGRNAQELFKHVYNCRKRNYVESEKESFVKDMIEVIEFNLQRKKYKNKIILFRIHETGDFYSQEYMNKWFDVIGHFKDNNNIKFQAYTKSLPYIENNNIPANFKVIFSIMDDTKIKEIELAKRLKLNTFQAVPSDIFENIQKEYRCEGSCAECKECYLGNRDMVVEYHGNRVPGKKSVARTSYDKQIYWSWKYKDIK